MRLKISSCCFSFFLCKAPPCARNSVFLQTINIGTDTPGVNMAVLSSSISAKMSKMSCQEYKGYKWQCLTTQSPTQQHSERQQKILCSSSEPPPLGGRTRGGAGQWGGGYPTGGVLAQRAHSAGTAPIITVIIQVTTLKTTHLRNHAQSIQNSKIQTSNACHGSQGPKFCPL